MPYAQHFSEFNCYSASIVFIVFKMTYTVKKKNSLNFIHPFLRDLSAMYKITVLRQLTLNIELKLDHIKIALTDWDNFLIQRIFVKGFFSNFTRKANFNAIY